MLNKLSPVQLSPFAEDDLREIWAYISENSQSFADKTVDDILHKCRLIAENPKIGTAKNRIIVGLRLFPHKSYNIFYFQTENGVEIYRVLHSSRDNIQIFDDVIDDAK